MSLRSWVGGYAEPIEPIWRYEDVRAFAANELARQRDPCWHTGETQPLEDEGQRGPVRILALRASDPAGGVA